MSSKPIRILIMGRPNVGKSTLFNRLIGRRKALVHDEPGVTRDRNEEITQWWFNQKPISIHLVDTGGLGGERFAEEIQRQVDIALTQTDLVLFVLDSQVGLTPLDEQLLQKMIQSGVSKKLPTIAVVNKVDAESHEERIAEFYALGLDETLTLSAEHGRGVDDLKLAIMSLLGHPEEKVSLEAEVSSDDLGSDLDESAEEDFEGQESSELEEDSDSSDQSDTIERKKKVPRIAVVGRPNVGKSTFMNAILREERMITSPIAGTTVDSIDSIVDLNGKTFIFKDTAGIRRKSKTEQGIEVLSIVQTKKALEEADLAILVLDGEKGITDQDEKIGGLIEEAGCSVVLAVNKWDTQSKNQAFSKEVAAERIRKKMGYLHYAPIVFMSALRKQGLGGLGDLLEEIIHQRQLKVATHEFTEWVREESTIHNPANAKFYLCHQSGRNPPTFVCHVNDPDKIHFSLRRHLVNALRERWGFMGTPVRMLFLEAKNRRSLPRKKKVASHRVKVPR